MMLLFVYDGFSVFYCFCFFFLSFLFYKVSFQAFVSYPFSTVAGGSFPVPHFGHNDFVVAFIKIGFAVPLVVVLM